MGKTSTAQKMAEILGIKYIPVDAPFCWKRLAGTNRQLCFLRYFTSELYGYMRRGVADNGIMSVYAYTKVMPRIASRKEFEEYLRLLSDIEVERAKVALLVVEPNELKKRIEKRLREDEKRKQNVVEKDLELHVKAQEILISFAATRGVPVIGTTNKTPEEVAREVIEALRK